jgi:hypothetical protein
MSALPPKADICSALAHVGFGPKSGQETSQSSLALIVSEKDRRLAYDGAPLRPLSVPEGF